MVFLVIFCVLCYLITGFIIADWTAMKTDEEIHWSVYLFTMVVWSLIVVCLTIVLAVFALYGLGVKIAKKFIKKNDAVTNENTDNTTTATE